MTDKIHTTVHTYYTDCGLEIERLQRPDMVIPRSYSPHHTTDELCKNCIDRNWEIGVFTVQIRK